jgi:shikimate dehydrogenase
VTSPAISGRTRLACVIGSPVAHSLSPALHNAAFAADGADWRYVAFEVSPGRADEALAAMRVLGLGGMSVTMPHKEQVARCVDVLSPAAAALRSVNTVVPLADGRLEGHSTDGDGFVASLAASRVEVAGRSVVVLGAGAAGRSVIDALARCGAAQVSVVNRTAAAADEAAALAGPIGQVASIDSVRDADIVVNATSIGMGSTDLPLDPVLLRAGQVVADLVYHPLRTTLLEAAESAGAVTVDGLGMLVHQAALQQRLWRSVLPDVSVLRAAAESELDARA